MSRHRATFLNRPVPDDVEPDQEPDRLGRMLLGIRRDAPGQWRDVIASTSRSYVRDAVSRLTGTSKYRIAGIPDVTGWEARLIEEPDDDGAMSYVLRVRYTPADASA